MEFKVGDIVSWYEYKGTVTLEYTFEGNNNIEVYFDNKTSNPEFFSVDGKAICYPDYPGNELLLIERPEVEK